MPAPRSRVPTPAQWQAPPGLDPLIYGLAALGPEWKAETAVALSRLMDEYAVQPLLNAPPERFIGGGVYITLDLAAVRAALDAEGTEAEGQTPGMFYCGGFNGGPRTSKRTYLGSGSELKRRVAERGRDGFVRLLVEVVPRGATLAATKAAVAAAEERWLRRLRARRDEAFMNVLKWAAGIGNKGGSKWTLKAMMTDAAQHATRRAWQKAPGGGWGAARRLGLTDLCCAHMLSKAEAQRTAARLLAQNPQWQANNKAANQRNAADREWRANNKAAAQRRSADPQWQANNKAAAQRTAADPQWQANNKAAREAMYADPQWRANTKAAAQRTAADQQWRARISAAHGILPRLAEPLRTDEARDLLADAMLAHGREAVRDLVLRLKPATIGELAAVLTPAPAMAAE